MKPAAFSTVLAALALTVSACESSDVGEPSTWTDPASYEYTLDSRCGEQLLHGRMKFTVAGGKVVKAEGLDQAGEGTINAVDGRLDPMPTLNELMSHYENARASGAYIALAEYDPADGHPTKITVDGDRNAIDDELCYTITGFAETIEPS
jgi:hypothetical protein